MLEKIKRLKLKTMEWENGFHSIFNSIKKKHMLLPKSQSQGRVMSSAHVILHCYWKQNKTLFDT